MHNLTRYQEGLYLPKSALAQQISLIKSTVKLGDKLKIKFI